MGRGNSFNTGSNSNTNQATCGGNSKCGLPKTQGMTTGNIAVLARLGVSVETRPGLPCTGDMFITKLNQANAGGVGKYVLSRKYSIATATTGGNYM